MTGCVLASRLVRYGSQLVAGLAVGVALATAQQARAETASDLLANPKRLEFVQLGCKTNQPWATEALCREAAEAIRRRFRGEGPKYTPHRVDPFPTDPTMKPAPAKPEAARRPQRHAARPN